MVIISEEGLRGLLASVASDGSFLFRFFRSGASCRDSGEAGVKGEKKQPGPVNDAGCLKEGWKAKRPNLPVQEMQCLTWFKDTSFGWMVGMSAKFYISSVGAALKGGKIDSNFNS